jgi:twitching motility protein PilT
LAPLEKLLTGGAAADRLAAARGLGEPAMVKVAPQALRLLAGALRDPVENVATAAIQSIAAIGSEADYHAACVGLIDGKNLKLAAAALEALKRFPTEHTAQVVERKLAQGPYVLRMAALAVIEAAAADPLLPPLVRALGHSHLAVRNRAAEVMAALARSGRVEVGRTLVWLLRSNDVNVRRGAADVLRSVSDPHGELWPKLVSSLRDDDWWVRERVMDALVELAGKGLSRYMVAWLADPSDVVRRFALSVLHRLKDEDTIGPLVHCALHDTDWWTREKAIDVIAEFNDPRAVPTLVEIMRTSPDMQVACVAALKRIDPNAVVAHVLPLASSPDPDVRLAVLRAIEERSEEQSEPSHVAVAEALRDDRDPGVQRAAHALLAKLRAGQAKPPADAINAANAVDAIDGLLLRALEIGVDDLILAPDRPAYVKNPSGIWPITEGPLPAERLSALLRPMLTPLQAAALDARRDVDRSYVVRANGRRFRMSVFGQRGGIGAVFHAARGEAPLLETLGLPAVIPDLCQQKNGLVLVAGPTGSGKTTTLAAIIDYINRKSACHVISVEDPIEVLHVPKQSLVNQREVGTHTRSFAAALRAALREDPDVLVVGDLRDPESTLLALTAAETGHLVFATVQTTSVDQAIERVIAGVAKSHHEQARGSVADVLRAVVSQVLVKGKDGHSRHVACEMMINNDATANLVRKGKTVQIASILSSAADVGMQTLDQDLLRLVRAGLVDVDDALQKARNRKELETSIGQRDPGSGPVATRRPISTA